MKKVVIMREEERYHIIKAAANGKTTAQSSNSNASSIPSITLSNRTNSKTKRIWCKQSER
ncbi:hypothetical protein [Lacticaseibacillus paracasei]|uniref:hypothetical protein n=1 Tax=Lacticaseibacillus paracasei TaxID=1597 RepID=UPI0033919ADF